MLVLSRKVDEAILLRFPGGYTAWVRIVDQDGGKVRLGIDAHQEIEVIREELVNGQVHAQGLRKRQAGR